MSTRAWLSTTQSLLLARLRVGIGLMRADQFWTMKEDHLRQGFYLLLAAADDFVGASLTQCLQAVGAREIKAFQSPKPPKQIALFCGPKL